MVEILTWEGFAVTTLLRGEQTKMVLSLVDVGIAGASTCIQTPMKVHAYLEINVILLAVLTTMIKSQKRDLYQVMLGWFQVLPN